MVKTASIAASVRTAILAVLQMDLVPANRATMVWLVSLHVQRTAMVSTALTHASACCPRDGHVIGLTERAPVKMDTRVSSARVCVPRDHTGVTALEHAPVEMVLCAIM